MHFARLYLYSHVFRGLGTSSVPPHFYDFAVKAVTEASSIINTLLNDQDIIGSLNGIPSYLHSMTAFACMFLVSVSTRRRATSLVNPVHLQDMISRLVELFRSVPTGKWHLVHLMAGGLEKVLTKMRSQPHIASGPAAPVAPSSVPSVIAGDAGLLTTNGVDDHGGAGEQDGVGGDLGGGIDWLNWAAETQLGGGLDGGPLFDMNFGFTPMLPFDPSTMNFGSSGQEF